MQQRAADQAISDWRGAWDAAADKKLRKWLA
jgi:hypothetical protein